MVFYSLDNSCTPNPRKSLLYHTSYFHGITLADRVFNMLGYEDHFLLSMIIHK
jgi:hypothetical protein